MLLQEFPEFIRVVNLLQAAYVWRPKQDLRPDAWPPLLPVDAPLWACTVQLIRMLVSLRAQQNMEASHHQSAIEIALAGL